MGPYPTRPHHNANEGMPCTGFYSAWFGEAVSMLTTPFTTYAFVHAEQWQGPSRLSAPIIKHRSYTNIESFVLGLASLAVAAHYTYSNNYNKDIQRGAGILGTLFCFAGLRTETTYGLPDGTSIGLHRNW